ncbi:hypothetical protein CONPUDRAFT_166904 [Coniophora puteana RWD-64-598 SS2]|uniref:Uncharacterized protein n=1 Tax=Coniophora puteana (strain RWD-64-598) TaxID=741705 RepID=A0A5M3MIY1_CONPW|nr:uncharacterized protein CONPUDRAFT_166904 [Coniophora puteana RWD-64-598 SS2]EIW79073.1 hypothetical protein CONPUDRAFT_166904 [Coniophora puteana RWD-64-598 SS2]
MGPIRAEHCLEEEVDSANQSSTCLDPFQVLNSRETPSREYEYVRMLHEHAARPLAPTRFDAPSNLNTISVPVSGGSAVVFGSVQPPLPLEEAIVMRFGGAAAALVALFAAAFAVATPAPVPESSESSDVIACPVQPCDNPS